MDTFTFLLTFSFGVLVGFIFVSIVKQKDIKNYREEIEILRNRLLRSKRK